MESSVKPKIANTVSSSPHHQEQKEHVEAIEQSQHEQLDCVGTLERSPVKTVFSTLSCNVLSDLQRKGQLCDAVIRVSFDLRMAS